MYELSKKVLTRVSFDKVLFRKELHKFSKWLKPSELTKLKVWCIASFGHLHGEIIMEVFEASQLSS